MPPRVSTEALSSLEHERPTGIVGVRQAVCDASRAVVGYEVLTGDPDAPPASARFSARALLEAFTDVDLDLIAPHHPAYLTVGPALLLRMDLLPVAPDRVVMQLEAVDAVHDDVVAAVNRLSAMGYVFAAVDPPSPESVLALPAIRLVRVDVTGLPADAVAARVTPFGAANLAVHAVGIASHDVFEACVAAGCVGFQGPFRALPVLTQAPPVQSGAMATAAELLAPDLDFERLEALITRDLELSYRLLRYANSAFFSRRREVGTVREAIVLLGERMTRRWALVVALAGGGARPDELLFDALVRGRALELLAGNAPGLNPDHAFTVGLFSMLPSLVNRPMEHALDGLGLPASIEAALLDGHPPYGALLDRMICHLDGDFGERADDAPGSLERLDAAYRGALAWVEQLRSELERAA
jgi:c-di-GMP phosphodiesterase